MNSEGGQGDGLCLPSERAYNERREEQKRAERREFHLSQADRLRRTLDGLIRYHEEQAEKYEGNGQQNGGMKWE